MRIFGLSNTCYSPFGGCDPVGSSFGRRAWFYSGIPSCNFAISRLGSCGSIPGSCGSLCCMVFSATGVYRMKAEELREHCAESGLDSSGPVRSLRRRLVDHINSAKMNGAQDQPDVQATVPTDLVSNGAGCSLH